MQRECAYEIDFYWSVSLFICKCDTYQSQILFRVQTCYLSSSFFFNITDNFWTWLFWISLAIYDEHTLLTYLEEKCVVGERGNSFTSPCLVCLMDFPHLVDFPHLTFIRIISWKKTTHLFTHKSSKNHGMRAEPAFRKRLIFIPVAEATEQLLLSRCGAKCSTHVTIWVKFIWKIL